MRRHRYMVVEHPTAAEGEHHFNSFVLPIHTMLGTYHWARLDADHVFVTGYYEVSLHDRLAKHPKVSVMPSSSSGKPLKNHLAQKDSHWNALAAKLSIDSSASMTDLIDAAEAAFGAAFGLDK
jgi:hypothetical protein